MATTAKPVAVAADDCYINVREVAHLLGLSVRTVWRYSACGKIPAPSEIGSARRWLRSRILVFMAARAAEAEAGPQARAT